jgi:hypothetical protein
MILQGPSTHCCNRSSIRVNLFLLRDDREAGHLLISAISEPLGSPAGEAIRYIGAEKSPRLSNGEWREDERGNGWMTRLRWGCSGGNGGKD